MTAGFRTHLGRSGTREAVVGGTESASWRISRRPPPVSPRRLGSSLWGSTNGVVHQRRLAHGRATVPRASPTTTFQLIASARETVRETPAGHRCPRSRTTIDHCRPQAHHQRPAPPAPQPVLGCFAHGLLPGPSGARTWCVTPTARRHPPERPGARTSDQPRRAAGAAARPRQAGRAGLTPDGVGHPGARGGPAGLRRHGVPGDVPVSELDRTLRFVSGAAAGRGRCSASCSGAAGVLAPLPTPTVTVVPVSPMDAVPSRRRRLQSHPR